MPKVREISNVRGSEDGFPLLLWRDDESGRLVVRAFNQGGFAGVDIDLIDLVEWLSATAPGSIDGAALVSALAATEHRE